MQDKYKQGKAIAKKLSKTSLVEKGRRAEQAKRDGVEGERDSKNTNSQSVMRELVKGRRNGEQAEARRCSWR